MTTLSYHADLCYALVTGSQQANSKMSTQSQQQLLSALHALYHNEDQLVKDEADRWLEQWQQGVEAWSTADALLHDPNSSMEAQYFCAQTLRTKVGVSSRTRPFGFG